MDQEDIATIDSFLAEDDTPTVALANAGVADDDEAAAADDAAADERDEGDDEGKGKGEQPREARHVGIIRATFKQLSKNANAHAASVPTPGGIGGLVVILLVFALAIIPVNQGYTRLQLLFLSLGGFTTLPADKNASPYQGGGLPQNIGGIVQGVGQAIGNAKDAAGSAAATVGGVAIATNPVIGGIFGIASGGGADPAISADPSALGLDASGGADMWAWPLAGSGARLGL